MRPHTGIAGESGAGGQQHEAPKNKVRGIRAGKMGSRSNDRRALRCNATRCISNNESRGFAIHRAKDHCLIMHSDEDQGRATRRENDYCLAIRHDRAMDRD